MLPYNGHLFFTAGIVLVILAVSFAGCTSNPGPAATTIAPERTLVNSYHPATPAPAAAGQTGAIAIKDFAFTPAILTVAPGTTVTWTNLDGAAHAIASDAGSPLSFASGSLAQGASYQFTLSQPGTYTYHCSIHPSMKGTIVVQS
jgi:plastocyanin